MIHRTQVGGLEHTECNVLFESDVDDNDDATKRDVRDTLLACVCKCIYALQGTSEISVYPLQILRAIAAYIHCKMMWMEFAMYKHVEDVVCVCSFD